MFKPTALYIKTHNKTGLKYFGKTTCLSGIHSYRGSGVHWRRHLKKHGADYTTELLGIWQDKERLVAYAVNFCERHDVVKSAAWANMVPEEGLQGAVSGDGNIAKRDDVRAKMSRNSAKNHLGKFGENHPSFRGWYVSPLGKFPSLRAAAEAHGISLQAVHQKVYGHKQKHGNWQKSYAPAEGWSFCPK